MCFVPRLALFASLHLTLSGVVGASAAGAPPLAAAPVSRAPVAALADLLVRIRDGSIARSAARAELRRLLDEVRQEYYRAGGEDFARREWVFPLAGYNSRAITGGRNRGYIPSGYDFFSGNRHGGHPSFDIFIRDRNRDERDDRSGRPVAVLSLTGGVVVGVEKDWAQHSRLRGGKYVWIYDPSNELLVYYAHNRTVQVEVGQHVRPGDVLGEVGRSGYNAAKRRSPTHLHLTVLKLEEGAPQPLNVFADLARVPTVNLE